MSVVGSDSSAAPKRVLVVDGDSKSRAEMVARLRGAGYDAVESGDPDERFFVELYADFAVIRSEVPDLGLVVEAGCMSVDASRTLTIGWLRPPQPLTPDGAVGNMDEAHEHVRRIFSVIAAPFMNVPPSAARRLVEGLRALRSTVWGPASGRAYDDCRPEDDDSA